MATIEDIVAQMWQNTKNARYADLCKVCDAYFGDPRINIQNHKGKAKAYQVTQVLRAIDKLEVIRGAEK
jgi:hypothetical protein